MWLKRRFQQNEDGSCSIPYKVLGNSQRAIAITFLQLNFPCIFFWISEENYLSVKCCSKPLV